MSLNDFNYRGLRFLQYTGPVNGDRKKAQDYERAMGRDLRYYAYYGGTYKTASEIADEVDYLYECGIVGMYGLMNNETNSETS